MEVRILGPLEVRDDAREVPVPAAKQRALLAILALHRGEVVSVERLIDELWGERPPATAAATIQVYVSQLRKALGRPELIVTRAPGYVLARDAGDIDVARFEELADAGRAALAVDPARALALLDEARGETVFLEDLEGY